jgi:hypothetical protein
MAFRTLDHSDMTLFKNRLWNLMERRGIFTPKELAKELLAKEYVTVKQKESFDDALTINNRAIGAVEKKIQNHLNSDDTRSLQGEFVTAYCNFFGCSADYLFGYIDLPTHSDTNIQNETGLSADSINFLKAHKSIYSSPLNKLLNKENFQYAIFHTGKFWDKLAELSSKEKTYYTGLKEMDAYSKATGGNYIGEPESVSVYRKLQKECEHQENQAIKYFNTLLSELGNKYNFRNNS